MNIDRNNREICFDMIEGTSIYRGQKLACDKAQYTFYGDSFKTIVSVENTDNGNELAIDMSNSTSKIILHFDNNSSKKDYNALKKSLECALSLLADIIDKDEEQITFK